MKPSLQKISLIFIGCAVGWVASSIYFKESHRPHKRPPQERRGVNPFKRLGVSPDVLSKITALNKDGEKKFRELDQKIKSSHREFDQLLSETKDQVKLRELFNKLIENKREIDLAHFDHMMKINSLLTIDQIKKLQMDKPPRGKRPPQGKRDPRGSEDHGFRK